MTSGEDRWDVFLAHAAADAPLARRLQQALTALGVSAFHDETSLAPGDDWTRAIAEALSGSRAVAVLYSRHTGDAFYTRSEIVSALELARRDHRRILPIALEPGVDPPYGLRALHGLQLDDDNVTEVAQAIADVVAPDRRAASVFSPRVPPVPAVLVGRDDVLSTLSAGLGVASGQPSVQVLQGVGGVGKTTVAAALCRAHAQRYDVVWWVRAADPGTLVGDLAELAAAVGVELGDGDDDDAAQARRWLQDTDATWLVVFDDAPDLPTINRWRPRGRRGDVVVTTRNAHFDAIGDVHPLPPLSRAASADLLRRRLDSATVPLDDDLATAVIDDLEGLPLALGQVASWIEQDPTRSLAAWRSAFDRAAASPTQVGGPLAIAWQAARDEAGRVAPTAPRLLALIGHLAPIGIPAPWLRDAATREPFLDASSSDDVDAGLDALAHLGLITLSDEDLVDVHAVTHELARRAAPPGAWNAAVRLVTAHDPGHSEPSAWSDLDRLAPHARQVAERVPPGGIAEEPALLVTLVHVADAARHQGRLRVAVDTAKLAASMAGWAFPATRLSLLATTTLAEAYMASGDQRMAITLLERAIQEGADLGAEPAVQMGHWSTLGSLHLDAGDVVEAIADYERALAIGEDVLAGDHRTVLLVRHNLAGAYHRAGRFEESAALFEATLGAAEQTLGPEHPFAVTSRHNLASVWRDMGRLDEATALLVSSLSASERILGPDHPDTLVSLNNLAGAYREAGDLDRATALYERTLAARERVLGADHPETLTSRGNLAGAYLDAGELDRATALYESVAAAAEVMLGPDHPTTLTHVNNLAVALQARGDLDRAIDLYAMVHRGLVAQLGPDHPTTRQSEDNLGRAREAGASSER